MERILLLILIALPNFAHKAFCHAHHRLPWDVFTNHKVFQDSLDSYFILPSLPVNHLTDGEIIAVPRDSLGHIIKAQIVSGQLPDGTFLYSNGTIMVTNHDLLRAGDYHFTVETTNARNKTFKNPLSIRLKDHGTPDRDAVFSINRKKNIEEYTQGEALASVYDHDGKILEAVHIKGKLPQGTILQDNGKIMVSNIEALKAGKYNVWIATADEKKGVTLFIITLTLQ